MSGKLYRSTLNGGGTPGRAVVGAESSPMVAMDPGGPMPIGMVAGRTAQVMPTAPAGGPGSRDASVMPTSMANDPIAPAVGSRPHVLSHLFGLSAIGRDRAERRARAQEEEHAHITYGAQETPLTEVPVSVLTSRSVQPLRYGRAESSI